jgi:sirohydrochlorin ferrochelatase
VTRCVLLAHGSPDPRSSTAVRRASAEVGARLPGHDVVAAFLDHDGPSLAEAVGGVPDERDVVVLPLLLSAAFHARVDVPAAVAGLARPVRLLDPLGHPPAVLDALLAPLAVPVVVVAAGTRVDAERAAFADAVADAGARTATTAVAAFATGPGPSVPDALVPDAVVLPWLLAPGRLLDATRDDAGAHAVVGGPLLEVPAMLDEVARRLAAAV